MQAHLVIIFKTFYPSTPSFGLALLPWNTWGRVLGGWAYHWAKIRGVIPRILFIFSAENLSVGRSFHRNNTLEPVPWALPKSLCLGFAKLSLPDPLSSGTVLLSRPLSSSKLLVQTPLSSCPGWVTPLVPLPNPLAWWPPWLGGGYKMRPCPPDSPPDSPPGLTPWLGWVGVQDATLSSGQGLYIDFSRKNFLNFSFRNTTNFPWNQEPREIQMRFKGHYFIVELRYLFSTLLTKEFLEKFFFRQKAEKWEGNSFLAWIESLAWMSVSLGNCTGESTLSPPAGLWMDWLKISHINFSILKSWTPFLIWRIFLALSRTLSESSANESILSRFSESWLRKRGF